jgi:Tol biopolymer transport system component/tRNA A-37 threonylcarbamoyl transferase component Bud32
MTTPSSRISGALSGHYRLDQEIGAGGMATVYLAEDLRHDRRVALKVLRPELAAVIGAERFLAEIKLTANLQHPHILPLFDSGEADSFLYYVMPFVEGESLRARLTREKQLPVADAVRIATEVASALDYAHRHGVIHRDIKPENILLHDGQALVADFGIALAASKAGGARMTETGMSLGTPHYMSPEQAMGEREITARSDVYALGCVLYEMLTGDPPFTGSTAQAVVARVLTESPRPLLPQRHTLPPHIEAAVLTALEKLPADRFDTAAEFAEALASHTTTRPVTVPSASQPGTPATAGRSRLRDPAFLALAAALVLAIGVAAVLSRPAPPRPELPPVRFLFTGSDSAQVAFGYPWPAAISPDGGTLVYSVGYRGGTILYARRSDQIDGHPIPGTENASQPLFSPDGEWLAFEAEGKEIKVRLDGSAPVTIADGGADNGADWTTTGELVTGATGEHAGLMKVSVAGGELTQFTRPDSTKGVTEHDWPIAAPDGRHVVFTLWSGALSRSKLAIASLDDGTVTELDVKGIRPLAVLDGVLVYLQADGAVMAVPIDVPGRKVTGKPVPVLDPVAVASSLNGNSAVFVSSGGALVSGLEGVHSTLMWRDRAGASRTVMPDVRAFSGARLSPDGRRIAVLIGDRSKTDVWIYDIETGTLSRLTSVGTVTFFDWTQDGNNIVYSAPGAGSKDAIWTQSVGGATAPEVVVEVPTLTPVAALAPDGRSLLVQSIVNTSWAVLRVSLDSKRAFRTYSAAGGNSVTPRISRDGRWAALSSSESGRYEVYVRSYPEPTVKVQVSVGGGSAPVWSADGLRLYYLSGTAIMEARLAVSSGFRVVSRDTAFAGVTNGNTDFGQANFDVSRDGSRIVIPSTESSNYPILVVPNWRTELHRRLAASR